jgi:hypothetical protein
VLEYAQFIVELAEPGVVYVVVLAVPEKLIAPNPAVAVVS